MYMKHQFHNIFNSSLTPWVRNFQLFYLQDGSIYTVLILIHPLAQTIHLCYHRKQVMLGEKYSSSVKLDNTLNLS